VLSYTQGQLYLTIQQSDTSLDISQETLT